jgi:tetratricopeptide (TPR) repeat protein
MQHAAAVLAKGDATVVQHAGQILASLPSPKACVDLGGLRSRPPPPRDPMKAGAVPVARARLAQTEISAIARPQEGVAALAALVVEIEKLDAPAVLAEAQFVLGEAELKADLTGKAAASLQRAAELALASGDDRLFVRAASRLAYVVGGFHNETARATDWLTLARQAFERTGSPPALAAWLSLQEVALHIGAGRWAECAKTAERAIAGARRENDHLHEAEATFILSFCTGYSAGPAAARPILERALELYLTWVGPAHPETADAMSSLADYRESEGDWAGAIEMGEQSLAITRSIGRPTLQLALGLVGQAARFAEVGRQPEALALRRESLAILRQVPHPPKSDVRVLADLASSERTAGLAREAWDHALEANAACTAEVQKGFPDVCAHAQLIHAKLLLDRKRRSEAAGQAARARDGFATLPHEPHLRERVEAWAREVGLTLPPRR